MGRIRLVKPARFLCFLIVLSLGVSACGISLEENSSSPIAGSYELDPVFGAIYGHLGGLTEAGAAISSPMRSGTVTRQYLETALLIYDSAAPISSKFEIAPLGVDLGISEPPVEQPQDPNIIFIDGHTISPEFFEVYEDLRPSIVGKPITEPRFHLVRKRYEQYFENLGFYRNEGSSEVNLLPYGLWTCRQECQTLNETENSNPDVSSHIDPVFEEFTNIYGTDFTGLALTNLYMDSEGRRLQILENMILSIDLQQGSTSIQLVPVSKAVNIIIEPLQPPSQSQGMYFFPVQDQLGYEIPFEIWDYIQNNGGISLIGQPITQFSQLTKGIFHQCFVNLCLTYDPSLPQGARVHPEPLGFAFKILYYHPEGPSPAGGTLLPVITPKIEITATTQPQLTLPTDSAVPTNENMPTGNEVNLRVWQRYSAVEPDQRQEIQIWLEENGIPTANKIVDLGITMPDGSQQSFRMIPTNLEGQSSLMLPVIEAKNGTIITYKACYSATPEMKFCDADTFVIWNNP